VEHFHTTVADKLGGKAKEMIVTSSRLHAVRYKLAVDASLKKLGSPYKALVPFTDVVEGRQGRPGIHGSQDERLPRGGDGGSLRGG